MANRPASPDCIQVRMDYLIIRICKMSVKLLKMPKQFLDPSIWLQLGCASGCESNRTRKLIRVEIGVAKLLYGGRSLAEVGQRRVC